MPFQSPKTVENCERCIGRRRKAQNAAGGCFSFRSRLARRPLATRPRKLTDFRSHTTTTGTLHSLEHALASERAPSARHRRRRGRIGGSDKSNAFVRSGDVPDLGRGRAAASATTSSSSPRDDLFQRGLFVERAREEGRSSVTVGQERRRRGPAGRVRSRRRRCTERRPTGAARGPERRAGHRAHAAERARALERGAPGNSEPTPTARAEPRRAPVPEVGPTTAPRPAAAGRRASPATVATAECCVASPHAVCGVAATDPTREGPVVHKVSTSFTSTWRRRARPGGPGRRRRRRQSPRSAARRLARENAALAGGAPPAKQAETLAEHEHNKAQAGPASVQRDMSDASRSRGAVRENTRRNATTERAERSPAARTNTRRSFPTRRSSNARTRPRSRRT